MRQESLLRELGPQEHIARILGINQLMLPLILWCVIRLAGLRSHEGKVRRVISLRDRVAEGFLQGHASGALVSFNLVRTSSAA